MSTRQNLCYLQFKKCHQLKFNFRVKSLKNSNKLLPHSTEFNFPRTRKRETAKITYEFKKNYKKSPKWQREIKILRELSW